MILNGSTKVKLPGISKVYVGNTLVYGSTPVPTWSGLCFTADWADSTIKLIKVGTPPIANTEYSGDGITWKTYDFNDGEFLLDEGEVIYFRNDITGNFSQFDNLRFVMTGKISASGNCNSMYIREGFENLTTLTYTNCFTSLFNGCARLFAAPELPATTLSYGCYQNMFTDCRNLTSAPELPATTLAGWCYTGMFMNCSKLNKITVAFNTWMVSTTSNWVSNISPTGTFYCPSELEDIRGLNNIPEGWTRINI